MAGFVERPGRRGGSAGGGSRRCALFRRFSNAQAEANLGVAVEKLEGCASAIPHFEEAIQIDPTLAAPEYNLGMCQYQDHAYAAAVSNFEHAIRKQPNYPDAQMNLALALSSIPDRTPDAIRELEEALQQEPEVARLHGELGLLLASLGRGDEAIEQLEKALDLDPLSNPEIELTLDRLRLLQQKLRQSDGR